MFAPLPPLVLIASTLIVAVTTWRLCRPGKRRVFWHLCPWIFLYSRIDQLYTMSTRVLLGHHGQRAVYHVSRGNVRVNLRAHLGKLQWCVHARARAILSGSEHERWAVAVSHWSVLTGGSPVAVRWGTRRHICFRHWRQHSSAVWGRAVQLRWRAYVHAVPSRHVRQHDRPPVVNVQWALFSCRWVVLWQWYGQQ